MSGDTFEFDDKARVERLVGTLHDPAATAGDVLTVQAGGAIAAAPGGGAMPIECGYQSSDYVEIANGDTENVLFDAIDQGTPLLDITDPRNPLFLATGCYAITALITSNAGLTPGGYAEVVLTWANGEAPPRGIIQGSATFVTLTAIANVRDDTIAIPLQASVFNADGAATRGFGHVTSNHREARVTVLSRRIGG